MFPKVPVSTIDIVIPSTQKTVKFSRFRVMEEKILLIAKQSGEDADILNAIKQVIDSCCQDPTFNIDDLTIVDIEKLFLALHAASVSNIVSLKIIDPQDKQTYSFEVDLNQVEVDRSNVKDNIIEVTPTISIDMSYPSAKLYGDKTLSQSKDYLFEIICKSINSVIDNQQVFPASKTPIEDIRNFVMSLDVNVYKKIIEFIDGSPSLSYTIKYTNSLGTEQQYVLSSLRDFFSW